MSNKREFEYEEVDISDKKLSADGSRYWWNLEGDALASNIFSLVQTLNNVQYGFWSTNFMYSQLYENIDSLVGASSSPLFNQYFDLSPTNQIHNSKLTYNVVKSCVDAATAKIAKNKPRVKFVTNNGDYKIQKKAKQLTQYMDGMFDQTKMHRHGVAAFRDACIFGTGCLKIYVDDYDKKVKVDRVLAPIEIIVDNSDARSGKPRQLHQRKVVSKEVLQASYPKCLEVIDKASVLPNTLSVTPDQVIVIESWHLPTNGKGGKHCICVDNGVLREEEYTKDYFPFVFFNWGARVQGFWGYGLTEELFATQLGINKTHRMIQAAQEINCVPRWIVEQGSIINKHAFYDAGIMEIKTGAMPPSANMQPAVPGDLYAYLNTLFDKAFQITGVSQLSAASTKPPGVNSGVAMREYQDINTERFAIQGEQYESLFVDAAKIVIDLSRDLYSKNKVNTKVKSKSNNKKFIESIEWKNCDLEDDQFNMECFPVSKLPTTPEGRLAFITELAQAGYIQQSQVIELMDMPDVDNYFSLTNASFDLAVMHMDQMIEDNEQQTPDPYMDLNMSKVIAQAYYLKSIAAGVDEERLELLRNYVQNCILMLNPPPAPQALGPAPMPVDPAAMPPMDPSQQGPAVAGPEPMAAPVAPPQSDLLPV